MAAPEISARATVRRNEAVFCTVDGAKFDGNEYASVMLAKTDDRLNLPRLGLLVFWPATPSAEGATEVGLWSWFGWRVDDRFGRATCPHRINADVILMHQWYIYVEKNPKINAMPHSMHVGY